MAVPVRVGVGLALAGLVGEPAAVALEGAPPDVLAAGFEPLLGDVRAAVGGPAQGHELPTGHGDVGVVGVGRVPPPAGLVGVLGDLLGREDQCHALGQGAVDLLLAGVVDHAVRLGEHGRADPVLVHGGVALAGRQQAILLLDLQDVVDRPVDRVAVRPLPRDVAAGEEGHHRQRRHGRAGPLLGPGAVLLVLGLVEPRQRLVDGHLDLPRHRLVVRRPNRRCRRRVRRHDVNRRHQQQSPGHRGREHPPGNEAAAEGRFGVLAHECSRKIGRGIRPRARSQAAAPGRRFLPPDATGC